MRLEARLPDRPDYAPVNVEGLGEMQVRGLTPLFELDGYVVTITDESRDLAAKAAKASGKGVPSAL